MSSDPNFPFATDWIVEPSCPWSRWRASIWNFCSDLGHPAYSVLLDCEIFLTPEPDCPDPTSEEGWHNLGDGCTLPRGIELQLCDGIRQCIEWIKNNS